MWMDRSLILVEKNLKTKCKAKQKANGQKRKYTYALLNEVRKYFILSHFIFLNVLKLEEREFIVTVSRYF